MALVKNCFRKKLRFYNNIFRHNLKYVKHTEDVTHIIIENNNCPKV